MSIKEYIGIVGSRTGSKDQLMLVGEKVKQLFRMLKPWKHLVISGGCNSGADWWAKKLAPEFGIDYLEAPAAWLVKGQYQSRAGILRNRVIAENCSKLFAFWDGRSPGTKSTIEFAQELGRPVWVSSY